jgi:hypothetical protein
MAAPINITTARMNRQVEDAQRMYQRVLVCWASDVSELRRSDRLIPRWRQPEKRGNEQGRDGFEPMNEAA